MALETILRLQTEVCEKDCKSFGFSETTGAYDVLLDPTGWGAPNPLTSNATAATLDIYAPGNSSATPTLSVNLLATTNFPNTNPTIEYLITNTALGLSGKLTDGLWVFVYTVTVNTVVYQQTIQKITTCNAKCCVDGLFGAIEDFDCDECKDEAIKRAMDASAFYQGMVSAAGCGKIDKFLKIQKLLSRLCNNTKCCG